MLRMQNYIKNTFKATMLLYTLCCSQSFLAGDFIGHPIYTKKLKDKIIEKLVSHEGFCFLERSSLNISKQEAAISATGLSDNDTVKVNYKIGKYLINAEIKDGSEQRCTISFSLTDLFTTEVKYYRIFLCHQHTIEGIADTLICDFEKLFLEADSSIKNNGHTARRPITENRKHHDKIYKETEKKWMELGSSAYDLERYCRAGKSFDEWARENTFSPSKAVFMAAIPGFSGMNYTKEWGSGIFWSASEAILLMYAFTRRERHQQYVLFSLMMPVTVADIVISKNSAVRKNKKTDALVRFYKNNRFPFSFMKGE